MPALRDIDDIEMVIIHCAATPNGREAATYKNELIKYDIETIDEWHRQRGFVRRGAPKSVKYKHVGYHYVVDVRGRVSRGRSLHEIGAHVEGHNHNSVGICMIGTNAFTLEQWASLRELIGVLELTISGHGLRVAGHREFANKECPGFDVPPWWQGRKGVPLDENICEPILIN